jgi:hypothetical protein
MFRLSLSQSIPFPIHAITVTRVTRRAPLVEQELLNLPEHLSSHPGFSGFVLHDF